MHVIVCHMPQAEEEELDVVDEALFLLRTEDDDRAAAKTSQQQADQDLMDKYLEGVLPGGWEGKWGKMEDTCAVFFT